MNKSEYLLKQNGRWVIDTHHAIKRLEQRGVATIDQLDTMLREMVNKIMGMKQYHRLAYNAEFFVWFRQIRQGFIVGHRRDTKTSNENKKHFFLVTCMPEGVQVDERKHQRITIK